MVGAEAGERASVGMASSWARAESAGARGKRQVGRGETETQGREKWARTTNPRKKCRITDSRVSDVCAPGKLSFTKYINGK